MLKRILLIALLLVCALPAFAQEATEVPAADAAPHAQRAWSLIDTVEITTVDDKPALHITGSMPDGCQRPTLITKERQGPVLFVDVYHEALPENTPCTLMLIPVEATVTVEELLTLDEGMTLPIFLVVNAQHFYVNVAQMEAAGTPLSVPEILLTPLTRTGLNNEDVWVSELTYEEGGDGFVYVNIAGTVMLGCNDPVLSRVMLMPDTEATYVIDVFRAIREPETCPLRDAPEVFEFSTKTPVEVGTPAVFWAQDVQLVYQPEGETVTPPTSGASPTHILHGIDTVEALLLESFPVQISLKVTGYQPDGCDVPVQVTQVRDGNNVKVEIFRELPADAICTMIIKSYENSIKLDGGFEPGTYTIDVNGTVITVKI
jgi:hypothetical protein